MSLYKHASLETFRQSSSYSNYRMLLELGWELTINLYNSMNYKSAMQKTCCRIVVAKKKAATTFSRNCLILRW